MIKCQNLTKSYVLTDQRSLSVLKPLNFEVSEGEFVSMMGPSGAGKTTVLNILGLLDQPTSGLYWLNNQAMVGASHTMLAEYRNQWLGFIFQHFFLLPKLSVRANIYLPLQYHQGDIDLAQQRCEHYMHRLGVLELANHLPSQLSGGQQQRVAICRALACKPKLLLADEPTGALDSENGHALMQLLQELNQSEGLTIFMITHDQQVANYAQRCLYLVDGQLHA